jgi:hypothetical protein
MKMMVYHTWNIVNPLSRRIIAVPMLTAAQAWKELLMGMEHLATEHTERVTQV